MGIYLIVLCRILFRCRFVFLYFYFRVRPRVRVRVRVSYRVKIRVYGLWLGFAIVNLKHI